MHLGSCWRFYIVVSPVSFWPISPFSQTHFSSVQRLRCLTVISPPVFHPVSFSCLFFYLCLCSSMTVWSGTISAESVYVGGPATNLTDSSWLDMTRSNMLSEILNLTCLFEY